jgi:oligopeptide/dipeptide ABC transporter ATP-binding protein
MGDMDAVVHHPRHPYAQLLIASVPPPDPGDRWQQKLGRQVTEIRRSIETAKGCVYRDRCPLVFDRCSQSPPPTIEVEDGHQVACYLYE